MATTPDEPNDEERLEKLPNDGSTPFQPAQDDISDASDDIDRRIASAGIDDTRPETDDDIDSTELYDEGFAGAAEVSEPNAGNTVVDYDPSKDQRRTTVSEDTGDTK